MHLLEFRAFILKNEGGIGADVLIFFIRLAGFFNGSKEKIGRVSETGRTGISK